MSNIFIPYPSEDALQLYLQQSFDGFFIGIEGFSSNFNHYVKKNELKSIVKELNNYNIKIFICLNNLYYNDEIDRVKELILEIRDLDITGICYTDIGVLNILNEINYDKEIFWYSNHLGTNSKTINFLEKRNVSYALLSNELSVREIINIKKNTNINIGVTLYGFLNMATSSRKLISNYFEHIHKKKNKNNYIFKDKIKDKEYFLVEKRDTNFFTNSVLNGIKFFPILIENKIDYIFLDDFMLEHNNFYNVIEAFSSLRNAPDDKNYVDRLEQVVDANTYNNTFYGFLEKESVYKVDDYE